MAKHLAIFDLDGTLIDSAQDVVLILNRLRKGMGKGQKSYDFFVPWLSLGGKQLIANCLEVSISEAPALLDEFRFQYASQETSRALVYDGAVEILEHLKLLGINIGICTNKPRNLAEKLLKDTDLIRYVSYMCAGGDLDTSKPNPNNLEVCLKYFSMSPKQAILIGDSTIDFELAKVCRVDFAFFSGGYDDGVDVSQVCYCFDSHTELKKIFQQDSI